MAFSDYTGLVGRGIGTVIGAYFGGPMGAQIGGAAGQMEGDKFGGVLKGDTDWTAMLTPGPAQQASQEPAQLGPLGQQALTQTQTDYNDMNKSLQGGGKTWKDILRLIEGNQPTSLYSIMGNQPDTSRYSIMGSTGTELPAIFNGFNLGLGGQPGNVSGDPMGSNIFLPNSDIQQLNPGTTEFSLPSNVAPPSSYSPDFAAAGPAAPAETAPTSTPQGFNWGNLGKALVGMGHVLSATGAGLNGDPNYIMRLQTQVNQAARDKSQAAQEQSKIDQQQQLIKLEKIKGLQSLLQLGQSVSESDNLSTEDKKAFAPQFSKMVFENTGLNLSPEFASKLLTGKGKAQQLAAAYPELHLTPEKAVSLIDRINKNPGQQEQIINGEMYRTAVEKAQAGQEIPEALGAHLNDKQQKQIGDMAFNQIMGVVNQMTPEGRAAVTNQQIMSLPNGKYITDEHYTRLKEVFPNVEAASVLKSQAESAPGRQQSESHFQQTKAMEESHFQQNKAQLERHHQESMANQAQQTETTKPVSEAELKGAANIVNSAFKSNDYQNAESDAARNQIVNDALKGQRLRLRQGATADDIHNKWFGLGSVNPAALPVEYIPYVGKGQGIPVTTPGKPPTGKPPAGNPGGTLNDKIKALKMSEIK